MGEHLTTRSWEVTKSELFTTSKHQFSSWIEKKLHSTSQSQTRTNKQGKKKKAWRNSHSHCLVISSQSEPHCSCLNASEIITARNCVPHIDEIYGKLWHDSQYWSTGRAWLFSLTISSYISKAEWTGLQSLPRLPYSSDLCCFLKPLSSFQGKSFQNQQDADFEENDFVVCGIPSRQGLMNFYAYWDKHICFL